MAYHFIPSHFVPFRALMVPCFVLWFHVMYSLWFHVMYYGSMLYTMLCTLVPCYVFTMVPCYVLWFHVLYCGSMLCSLLWFHVMYYGSMLCTMVPCYVHWNLIISPWILAWIWLQQLVIIYNMVEVLTAFASYMFKICMEQCYGL